VPFAENIKFPLALTVLPAVVDVIAGESFSAVNSPFHTMVPVDPFVMARPKLVPFTFIVPTEAFEITGAVAPPVCDNNPVKFMVPPDEFNMPIAVEPLELFLNTAAFIFNIPELVLETTAPIPDGIVSLKVSDALAGLACEN
jgi:hypothetical protein